MSKRLLIIGAGIEQIRAYQLAREMGLQVVGSDINHAAPAFDYADDRIIASTRNPDETIKAVLEFVKLKPIHGVMTIANDVPLTVATVASRLNLPGISIEAACIASNKLLMKKSFAQHGVSTPWFSIIKSLEDLKKVINERGFPLVIKPLDGRGARGVLRLTEIVDVNSAYTFSCHIAESQTLLVEEFVDGQQLSSESFIYDNTIHTAAYSDRNYEYIYKLSPFMIENGGEQPADLSVNQKKEIDHLLFQAARAIGISEGIIKGDVVIDHDEPKIIELAARLSGGYFASDQIRLATGIDLVRHVINHSLGEMISTKELVPENRCGVAIRYWFPPEGQIKNIRFIESIENIPGIHKYMIYRKIGDFQPKITDHTKRAGFVIAKGANKKQAVERAERAINIVQFDVDP